MKYFTIICSVLLVLLMAGTLIFVGASPDFVAPGGNGPDAAGADDPVWDMKMDDLLNYLEGKGYIDLSTKVPLASGVATEMWMVSGLELGWWDVDNLDEKSAEYKVYQDLLDGDGVVLIYGGSPYSVTGNGPFSLNIRSDFTGDVNKLTEDFLAFGRTGGDDRSAPVWSMTMDDLLNYMEEKGFVVKDEMTPISAGVGTEAWAYNSAEFYWWDVDNLVEGSDEAAAWEDMNTEGVIDIWRQGTMFMAITPNGPFGMSFTYYTGDAKALLEAFEAFGH